MERVILAKSDKFSDKRKYVRLKSTFSIQFTIVHLQGDLPGLGWKEGQTRDVSKGGLGLETSELDESTIRFLNKEDIYLDLRIKVPLSSEPVKAVCDIAWFEPMKDNPSQYFIGMKFRSITSENLKRILKHASWQKFIPDFIKRRKVL